MLLGLQVAPDLQPGHAPAAPRLHGAGCLAQAPTSATERTARPAETSVIQQAQARWSLIAVASAMVAILLL